MSGTPPYNPEWQKKVLKTVKSGTPNTYVTLCSIRIRFLIVFLKNNIYNIYIYNL